MTKSVTIRPAEARDLPAISDLHKAAFGPGRFARSAYRVREGTPQVSPHCRVATLEGGLAAALRMTEVTIGGKPGALLLGPVAVDPELKGLGHGRALIAAALEDARRAGFRLVVLVGDLPYYGRFGFEALPAGAVTLPGPVDPKRLLGLELEPGAASEYQGMIAAATRQPP